MTIIQSASILILLSLAASASEPSELAAIRTIEDLDRLAAFNFAIMSDNKGDSPKNSTQFARMVEWIEKSGDMFVIGLGDHLYKPEENSFLPFLSENKWWHDHFYPNVADGENEYYGRGQGDWGAGKKIFDLVGLSSRKHVRIRPNGAEYYARIAVKDYTVHLVQLSFPDEPADPQLAFPPDSRKYLVETIQRIEKGEKDIIIACAHTRFGYWTGLLSKEQRKVVMAKADLVLSATMHIFGRIPVRGYQDRGAICINTGSITYPRFSSPPGYVQVHVLENPARLIVQYIRVDTEQRKLQPTPFAWIKHIGGKIEPAKFPASIINATPHP